MISATRNTPGFSLPEFAIVIAVTALLVGLGASAYRTHIVRAEVADSIALAARAQKHVATSFRRDGEPPTGRESAGLSHARTDDNSPYVDWIDVVDGRVELHFGNDADAAIAGRTLSLTPYETVDREVVWVCGNRLASPGLRPLGFAGGTRQAVQVLTQIEARYLPSTCR